MSALEDAIDTYSGGDPRIGLAMRMASYMEGGGGPEGDWGVGDSGQSFGPYQIYRVAHPDITPEQATDPWYATQYMLPSYQAAADQVPQEMWDSDPQSAAALTAFYAERPAQMYDPSTVANAYARVAGGGGPQWTEHTQTQGRQYDTSGGGDPTQGVYGDMTMDNTFNDFLNYDPWSDNGGNGGADPNADPNDPFGFGAPTSGSGQLVPIGPNAYKPANDPMAARAIQQARLRAYTGQATPEDLTILSAIHDPIVQKILYPPSNAGGQSLAWHNAATGEKAREFDIANAQKGRAAGVQFAMDQLKNLIDQQSVQDARQKESQSFALQAMPYRTDAKYYQGAAPTDEAVRTGLESAMPVTPTAFDPTAITRGNQYDDRVNQALGVLAKMAGIG